ncbi:polysaccharide deacetylase family protein [Cytobacillus dafuensis]|uniref:Polysaccharide deacetylase n=1 Tax=Cytobacillus dafuensis TaxID=1742359 RepID=A0A5B8Z528_CYTDA|nr:polysaccharide deacetylase family protein [Cytobacillus dafuensis]QED48214.1 polysaccharide deacetylase [Cytobacillus dafuensis]
MRRKRKRKSIKTRTKLMLSMMVCTSLVLVNFDSSKKNETLAVSSLTQPINIMYSLMTNKNFQQYDEMNGPIHNYFRRINNNNNKQIKVEKDKKINEGKETNIESQKQIVKKETVDKTAGVSNSNTTESSNKGNKQTQTIKQQNELKKVYLTFDDGPSAYTNDILETLSSYGMKATFFMLEPNMRTYPEEVKSIINNGHIPALHGVTHNTSKIYSSEKTVVDEMTKAQATLKNLTGEVTHLIRTPYGSAPYMKPSYKQAVETAGFQLWDWTVDSEDWKYKNGEYVSHVIYQIENYPYRDKPIIILLHDRKTTAEHLPALLEYLKSKGYEAEILNEQMTAINF